MRSDPSGLVPVNTMPAVSFQSRLLGVAQGDTARTVFVTKRLLPAWWPFVFTGAVGVFQPASAAAPGSLSVPCAGSPFGPSCWHGVGHDASFDTASKPICTFFPLEYAVLPFVSACVIDRPPFGTLGVGHEVKPLSDVGRTIPRSAGIERPDGVTRCFHVSTNKVEPSEPVTACNLFAKDNARFALANEPRPVRPEMAAIIESACAPCGTERLAGTASGPDWPIIGPSGAAQRIGPDSNPGEKVALGVSNKLAWLDIRNAPFVNIAGGNVPGSNQIPQPLCGIGVDLVIVGAHLSPSCGPAHASAPVWSWASGDRREQHPRFGLAPSARASCRQRLVGNATSARCRDEAIQPVKGLALHIAVVQAENLRDAETPRR
jgi:hypothetical protein